MPPDERILKQPKTKKANRYKAVHKNEVKFRGKRPAHIDYENNKQKMEVPTTRRRGITPLVGRTG